ncbi:MAG: hypothetical protein ACYDCG_17675 [Candidatus Acidiferrales bacterium]|mgnify:CR=1 FL=1
MADENTVFGIYPTVKAVEEAVDELIENGFASRTIFVLHPKNQSTIEFAQRKHTKPPAGTSEGPTADLPLDGTLGFWDVAHGPREGALPGALVDMGVPREWCDGRVIRGKLLISIKCNTWEEFFRATGILKFTEATDISWSVSLAGYRAQQTRDRT